MAPEERRREDEKRMPGPAPESDHATDADAGLTGGTGVMPEESSIRPGHGAHDEEDERPAGSARDEPS